MWWKYPVFAKQLSGHSAIEKHVRRSGTIHRQLLFKFTFTQRSDSIIIADEPYWLRICAILCSAGYAWHDSVARWGTNVGNVVTRRQGDATMADHCIQLVPAYTAIWWHTETKQRSSSDYHKTRIAFTPLTGLTSSTSDPFLDLMLSSCSWHNNHACYDSF